MNVEQVKLSLSIDSGSIPKLEYEDEASEATLDLRTTSSHSRRSVRHGNLPFIELTLALELPTRMGLVAMTEMPDLLSGTETRDFSRIYII